MRDHCCKIDTFADCKIRTLHDLIFPSTWPCMVFELFRALLLQTWLRMCSCWELSLWRWGACSQQYPLGNLVWKKPCYLGSNIQASLAVAGQHSSFWVTSLTLQLLRPNYHSIFVSMVIRIPVVSNMWLLTFSYLIYTSHLCERFQLWWSTYWLLSLGYVSYKVPVVLTELDC